MTNDCACSRPIQDTAVICMHCGWEIDAALAEIVEYDLAYELDVALSKQARIAERNGSRSATVPLPYHSPAGEVAADLKAVLVGWVKLIVEETGADTPDDTITALVTWLRPRVGWLRHHEAGQEAHGEIVEAVHRVWRVIDRRPERWFAGPCDACGEDLYARAGAEYVTCRNVECRGEDGRAQMYPVEQRRTWLLSALDDYLANSMQVSRLVKYLGIQVADATIRGWSLKGRIASHGTDRDGNRLYRLGEVVRKYYEQKQAKAS